MVDWGMDSYTTARALELLPAGGTRLHRALLKGDSEAILGWVEAGADPWARSGPLPDKLRLLYWGSETRGTRKVPKGPVDLPAVALAVLLANDDTWPAVKALLARTDLAQDTMGWVFEAALRSKAPPRADGPRWAPAAQEPLSPCRPAALWPTLLTHGLVPPSKDTLPSQQGIHRPGSAVAQLPTEWRQQMERHLGWARFAHAFEPGHSPLDTPSVSTGAAFLVEAWLPWITQGMPMANPQATLVNLVGASVHVAPTALTALVQALVARGARLNVPLQTMETDQPHRWPTAASWALEAGHPERAVLLQALQGRTWADSAGEPGSLTPAAELLVRELMGTFPYRYSGFFRAQEQPLALDATGSQARGWRLALGQLPVPDQATLAELVAPFQRWLALAKTFGVPDTGEEAGQTHSATVLCLHHLAQGIVTKNVWPKAAGHEQLTQVFREWAAYSGQPVEAAAQAHLTRLMTDALGAKDPSSLQGLTVWAPILTPLGATVTAGQTEALQQHILRIGAHDPLLPVMVERLASVGVHPCAPVAGVSLWDALPITSREAILVHLTGFTPPPPQQWQSPQSVEDLLLRQLADAKTPIASWFEATQAPVLPLTLLEQALSLSRFFRAPPATLALHGLIPEQRAVALLPFLEDREQRGTIPAHLQGRWAEARAFLRQLDRQLTPPEASTRTRPRLRS